MILKQLDPPLYLETTFGPAICHLVWSTQDHLWWCCFQEETGEPWWFPNHLVRLSINISEGRTRTSPIKLTPAIERALAPHRKRYAKPRGDK